MKPHLAASFSLILATAGVAVAAPASLRGLDARVHKAMQQWHVPGLAIAVVKDGKVVLARGYGVRELGRPGKVDADTLFTIASVSKQFTAAALGTLVSSGKLDWDAPAAKYLDNFKLASPWVTSHITLRDLLTHRSGYCDPGPAWFTSDASDIIQRLRYQKPRFGFRTHFCYDNITYLAAARFIPAVTHKSWNTYVESHLLAPLHMSRTVTTSAALAEASNVASPHGMVEGKPAVIRPYWAHNLDALAPVVNINSSVNDMSHWLLMLLANGRYQGRTVLASSVVRQMETPQVLIGQDDRSVNGYFSRMLSPDSDFYAYGLGLMIEDLGGHKLVWHPGTVDGMTSFMALVPDARLGIVVLTNRGRNDGGLGILLDVLQSYLGLPQRDISQTLHDTAQKNKARQLAMREKLAATRQPDTHPPLPLQAYAGNYRDDLDGSANIALNKGHLVLRLANPNFTGDLEHWHGNTFRVTWRYGFYQSTMGPNYVTFDVDAFGAPKRISFTRVPLHYERVRVRAH